MPYKMEELKIAAGDMEDAGYWDEEDEAKGRGKRETKKAVGEEKRTERKTKGTAKQTEQEQRARYTEQMAKVLVSQTGPIGAMSCQQQQEVVCDLLLMDGRALSTAKGYSGYWKRWSRYCAGTNQVELPADPCAVAMWLWFMQQEGLKAGTCNYALSAVVDMHKRAGVQSPRDAYRVKAMVKVVAKLSGEQHGPKVSASTLRLKDLQEVAVYLDARGRVITTFTQRGAERKTQRKDAYGPNAAERLMQELMDKRDYLLLMLLFTTGMRPAEIVQLRMRDIEFIDYSEAGQTLRCVEVYCMKSKTAHTMGGTGPSGTSLPGAVSRAMEDGGSIAVQRYDRVNKEEHSIR